MAITPNGGVRAKDTSSNPDVIPAFLAHLKTVGELARRLEKKRGVKAGATGLEPALYPRDQVEERFVTALTFGHGS